MVAGRLFYYLANEHLLGNSRIHLFPLTSCVFSCWQTLLVRISALAIMESLLQKKDKEHKLDFVSHEQLVSEMDELLKYYGADKSQANLERTRKILSRFIPISDEVSAMREENR